MANPAPNTEPQTTHTEVGHDAGGHTNFPPFDSSTFPSQLVWLAITFGALYYFMAKRFLPQVGAVIAARHARIAADLDEATRRQQEAEERVARHEKTLAEARANAQALLQAERERLVAESDAKRKSLEKGFAAKLAEAEAGIAATRAEAMTSVGSIAEETAGAIIERLLGRSVDQKAVANAVAAAKTN
jgi:F-type H+-transporting ATPase subunit b